MRGTFRTKELRVEEQFYAVNDVKLQMTLTAVADKYSNAIREYVYKCYQDDRLALIYRRIRNSGLYETGGKSKVRRKIVEFPNAYVYDFIDTVLSTLYGTDWITNDHALRHDLVRPWWVINKL